MGAYETQDEALEETLKDHEKGESRQERYREGRFCGHL